MRYLLPVCAVFALCAWGPIGGGSGEVDTSGLLEAPVEVTDGMVIKFDWEDASGGNSTNLVSAYDVVKATLTNGGSHSPDAYGTMDVISLTNSTNFIAVTSSYTYLSQYSSWTVCAWVYASTTTSNGFYFFDKENSSAGCEFFAYAPSHGSLNLQGYLDMNTPYSSALTASKPVSVGDLMLVSIVFNRIGENDITFHVNSTTYNPSARNLGSGGQSNDSANEWRLGNVWSGARALIGDYGVFRVYNRALSGIELEAIYEYDKYTYSIN